MSVRESIPQNSTPKKGDIIINPKTQRPVKVGSRTWLKLVKDGLVEGRYQDPNELYTVQEQAPEMIEQKIKQLNKTLPRGTQAVRGRGKYAGKIVKRQKRPSPQEMSEYTAKVASRVVTQNPEILNKEEETNYEDIEKELERMILEEMMIGQPQQVKKSVGHQKKKPTEQEQYYTEQPQEYDEDENFYEGEEKEFYEQ